MADAPSMTDDLLGVHRADRLITALEAHHSGRKFAATRQAAALLPTLGLSERARSLASALLHDVPGSHVELVDLTRRLLNDPEFGRSVDGWVLWPVGLAVAKRSIEVGTDSAFDAGMAVLRELTPRFTSEFSVRPMLLHNLPRALTHMESWVDDTDWNVRRLASEGSRPLLPWAERLPEVATQPASTRHILDALHADSSESVRRSVANHLNDHSRTHADYAVQVAAGWLETPGPHTERTVGHALRTLIKRGDAGALALLGFDAAALDWLQVPPLTLSATTVPAEGSVRFSAEIENHGPRPAHLMVDYILFFPDARGAERSKVFKIGQRELEPGDKSTVEATHPFRRITTRRYYPGSYGVALQINGVQQPRVVFDLSASDSTALGTA